MGNHLSRLKNRVKGRQQRRSHGGLLPGPSNAVQPRTVTALPGTPQLSPPLSPSFQPTDDDLPHHLDIALCTSQTGHGHESRPFYFNPSFEAEGPNGNLGHQTIPKEVEHTRQSGFVVYQPTCSSLPDDLQCGVFPRSRQDESTRPKISVAQNRDEIQRPIAVRDRDRLVNQINIGNTNNVNIFVANVVQQHGNERASEVEGASSQALAVPAHSNPHNTWMQRRRASDSSNEDNGVGPGTEVNVTNVNNLSIGFHRIDLQEGRQLDLQDGRTSVVTVVDWENERVINEEWGNRQRREEQRMNTEETQINEELQGWTQRLLAIQQLIISSLAESRETSDHDNRELEGLRAAKEGTEENEKALLHKLQEDKRKSEEKLKSMEAKHKEALRREREKFMRFIMRVEERDSMVLGRAAAGLEEWPLRDVLERLYRDFDVRLLAIDSGMTFLLDTPVEHWIAVAERQIEIRSVLAVMLPERVRERVTWSEVTQCGPEVQDVDLHVGLPLPEQVCPAAICAAERPRNGTYDNVVGGMPFNPMSTTPQQVYVFWPDSSNELDRRGPFITDMLITDDGKLVLADNRNNMLKVAGMENLNDVVGVHLEDAPLRLALLPDDSVAITTLSNVILIADVSGTFPFVASWVQTAKQYIGVASSGNNATIIVSCGLSSRGPAAIDVIKRDGTFLKTIVGSDSLHDLCQPDYIHVLRWQNLLVSDSGSNRIFVIEPLEGRVVDTYIHQNVRQPRKVITDNDGNCYVASEGSKCVLVRSVHGTWRRLLYGPQHGDGPRTKPWAVCLVGDILVVIWDDKETYAIGTCYKLPG